MGKTLFSKDYQVLLRLLRDAREKSRATQEVVADSLGTTQSIISKCERGERRLDVIELRRWCQALDISFTSFLAEFEIALSKRERKKS
jgi:transcriptional regulator with XRE-family HTH domain